MWSRNEITVKNDWSNHWMKLMLRSMIGITGFPGDTTKMILAEMNSIIFALVDLVGAIS